MLLSSRTLRQVMAAVIDCDQSLSNCLCIYHKRRESSCKVDVAYICRAAVTSPPISVVWLRGREMQTGLHRQWKHERPHGAPFAVLISFMHEWVRPFQKRLVPYVASVEMDALGGSQVLTTRYSSESWRHKVNGCTRVACAMRGEVPSVSRPAWAAACRRGA
jgi:hypothetical protein